MPTRLDNARIVRAPRGPIDGGGRDLVPAGEHRRDQIPELAGVALPALGER